VYPPRRPTKLQARLERKHAALSARSLTAAQDSSRPQPLANVKNWQNDNMALRRRPGRGR